MKGRWGCKTRENLALSERGDRRRSVLGPAQRRDSGSWHFIPFYDNDLNEEPSHAMKHQLPPPRLGSLVPLGQELSWILLKSAPWCWQRELMYHLSYHGVVGTLPQRLWQLLLPRRAQSELCGHRALLFLGLGLPVRESPENYYLPPSRQLLECMACSFLCSGVYSAPENISRATAKGWRISCLPT